MGLRSAVAYLYVLICGLIVSLGPVSAQAIIPQPGSGCDATCAYQQAQQAINTNLSGPINMAPGSTVGGSPIASTSGVAAQIASTAPSLAPVQSVNSQTGAVSVATGSSSDQVNAAISAATANLVTSSQAAAAAPVQSVNAQTGAVTVPTITKQFGVGTPSNTTGAVTWNFAATPVFATPPYCFTSVSSASGNYVFSVKQTAISASSVSFSVLAAASTLTISLGALTIWGPPPTGTTIGILCMAAS